MKKRTTFSKLMKTKVTRPGLRLCEGRQRVPTARSACESRVALEVGRPLWKLKRILVPIDFSEESIKALRYAKPFAEEFGAEIILLHVVEPVVRPEYCLIVPGARGGRTVARMNEREQQLARLRHREIGEAIKDDNVVHMGKPYEEIVNLARAKKVDLIVIATHGYKGLKHVFLGSTTERVVRFAPCPVLVVREKENEFISMPSVSNATST